MAVIEKALNFAYPHGFSTRIGGVSTGVYESLNLGMNRGDDKELVIKNWDLFRKASGITNEQFVCGEQIHSNIVHIATKEDLRPAYGPGFMNTADGYVTNLRNVPIAIFTADCVPLLLEDSKAGVIGAIHCGWKSTVADIEKEAVTKMASLGSDPSDIRAAVGPSNDRCCFEVGPEVITAVSELLSETSDDLYTQKPKGKFMLDLRGVVKRRLEELGVLPEHIEYVGGCTMCNPTRYWSHRYTGGVRGSQASIIMIP